MYSVLKQHRQGRIQPVSLGGAMLVIFGSQVSLRVHYCEKDEVCFTTLLWQNNGRQNGLISRMLFSKLFKIMVKKVTFIGFRGERSPQSPTLDPPLSACHNCWNKLRLCANVLSITSFRALQVCAWNVAHPLLPNRNKHRSKFTQPWNNAVRPSPESFQQRDLRFCGGALGLCGEGGLTLIHRNAMPAVIAFHRNAMPVIAFLLVRFSWLRA